MREHHELVVTHLRLIRICASNLPWAFDQPGAELACKGSYEKILLVISENENYSLLG